MLRDIKIIMMGAAALIAAGCSYDGGWDEPNPGHGGKPGPITGHGFGISVGGASSTSSTSPATRAEYDGTTYEWSPGDEVGFYMVPAGGAATPVVANARLKSVNTVADRFADFEGEITETSIRNISPDAGYDYYSYFPYNAANAGFPNVSFDIPGEMTLMPDVFPVEYGFMVAEKVSSSAAEQPLTWLDGEQQRFGKYVGFRYKHVFAYLEVYLSLNLMSQPVNKVVVTCTDGSAMSGTANINLQTGAVNFSSGSNSITVNIGGGGLNIWDDNGVKYTKVWIPINPALAGKEFKFDFYSAVDARNTHSVTKPGGTLQAGMKHKAAFKLPFYLSFEDLNGGEDDGEFTHKGYNIWGNTYMMRNNYSLWWSWTASGRGNGVLRLPLNVLNTYGATSIPVRVSLDSKRNGSLNDRQKKLNYAAITTGATDFSGTGTPDLNSSGNITGNTGFGVTSFNMTFTLNEPCFGLKSTFTSGAYYHFVRSIRIEPL